MIFSSLTKYIKVYQDKLKFEAFLKNKSFNFNSCADFLGYFELYPQEIHSFKRSPKNLIRLASYFFIHVSKEETPDFLSFLEANKINIMDKDGNNLAMMYCHQRETLTSLDTEEGVSWPPPVGPRIFYKRKRYFEFSKKLTLLLASSLTPTINQQNSDGENALMILLKNKHYDAALIPLQFGIDTLAVNKEGLTALNLYTRAAPISTHIAGVEINAEGQKFVEELKVVMQKQTLDKTITPNSNNNTNDGLSSIKRHKI